MATHSGPALSLFGFLLISEIYDSVILHIVFKFFIKVILIYTLMKVSHEKSVVTTFTHIIKFPPYPNAVAVHQCSEMPQIH